MSQYISSISSLKCELVTREQGREEALAYLRNANGGGDGPVIMGSPVAMGVTSVAPPAAAAAVEYNQYNPNFPNYHYQVPQWQEFIVMDSH